MLSLKNLSVDHGALRALWDISLDVGRGEKVGLLGANGAGKSTTMGAIVGLYPKAGGTIHYDGQTLDRASTAQTVAGGIALVPEGRRVFPFLSVRENLEMGGYKYRKDKPKVAALIERMMDMFPRLRERADQRAGTLSGGEQQMLALSRALMSEPRLLCLDEPSLGLAPIVVQEIFRGIRSINATGTSVLLVEQNARYALETAQRGYVLQTGSVIASGACADLKHDERVKEAYLGRR